MSPAITPDRADTPPDPNGPKDHGGRVQDPVALPELHAEDNLASNGNPQIPHSCPVPAGFYRESQYWEFETDSFKGWSYVVKLDLT